MSKKKKKAAAAGNTTSSGGNSGSAGAGALPGGLNLADMPPEIRAMLEAHAARTGASPQQLNAAIASIAQSMASQKQQSSGEGGDTDDEEDEARKYGTSSDPSNSAGVKEFRQLRRRFPDHSLRGKEKSEETLDREYHESARVKEYGEDDPELMKILQGTSENAMAGTPPRHRHLLKPQHAALGSFIAELSTNMPATRAAAMMEILVRCEPLYPDEFFEAARIYGITDVLIDYMQSDNDALAMWAARFYSRALLSKKGYLYYFERNPEGFLRELFRDPVRPVDVLQAMAEVYRSIAYTRMDSVYTTLICVDFARMFGWQGMKVLCALKVFQLEPKPWHTVRTLLEAYACFLEAEMEDKDVGKDSSYFLVTLLHEVFLTSPRSPNSFKESEITGIVLTCLGLSSIFGGTPGRKEVATIDIQTPALAFLKARGADPSTPADMVRGSVYALAGHYYWLALKREAFERMVEADGTINLLARVMEAHVTNNEIASACFMLIGAIGNAASATLLSKMRTTGYLERISAMMLHVKNWPKLLDVGLARMSYIYGNHSGGLPPSEGRAAARASPSCIPAALYALRSCATLRVQHVAADLAGALLGVYIGVLKSAGRMIEDSALWFERVEQHYPFFYMTRFVERCLAIANPVAHPISGCLRTVNLLVTMPGSRAAFAADDSRMMRVACQAMEKFPSDIGLSQAVGGILSAYLRHFKDKNLHHVMRHEELAEMRRAGAMEAMRAALNGAWTDRFSVIIILELIQMLMQDIEGARYFYEHEGLRQLVDVTKHHRDAWQPVRTAMEIMERVTDPPVSDKPLVGENELRMAALDAIARHPNIPVIPFHAMTVLFNCSRTAIGRDVVRASKEHDALALIQSRLRGEGFDEYSYTALIFLAGILRSDKDDRNYAAFLARAIKAGIAADVLYAIRQGGTDGGQRWRNSATHDIASLKYFTQGCHCIIALAKDATALEQMHRGGVVDLLTAGLDFHVAHGEAVEMGMNALSAVIAPTNMTFRERYPNILPCVVRAFNQHMESTAEEAATACVKFLMMAWCVGVALDPNNMDRRDAKARLSALRGTPGLLDAFVRFEAQCVATRGAKSALASMARQLMLMIKGEL